MLILRVNLTLVKSGEEYQDGYIIMVNVKIINVKQESR